jgi:membrane dipeptidase
MKNAGMVGQVFAIWTNARTIPDGYAFANSMIDCFYEFLKTYPNDLAFAGSARDFEINRRNGKISAFLSLEGSEPIRTLDDIDYFYGRGIRMVGLAWNYQTLICDTAHDGEGRNPVPYGGLSSFGFEAVKRMNRVGIIIDVSHASDDTVRHVLATSTDPIVASHSCASGLHSHYRNLKDELIVGICARGGVIGVIFNPPFLTPHKQTATVEHIANHVEYIAKIGGSECVALGSDFDGGIRPPPGLRDAGEIQNLAEVLRQRSWSEDKLRKLYYGNFLRLLKQVADE